jgi:hypothetical protein
MGELEEPNFCLKLGVRTSVGTTDVDCKDRLHTHLVFRSHKNLVPVYNSLIIYY